MAMSININVVDKYKFWISNIEYLSFSCLVYWSEFSNQNKRTKRMYNEKWLYLRYPKR